MNFPDKKSIAAVVVRFRADALRDLFYLFGDTVTLLSLVAVKLGIVSVEVFVVEVILHLAENFAYNVLIISVKN